MAPKEVVVDSGGSQAKLRDPGLVVLWTFLTLGIYNAVWYYRINRELRDYGRAKGDEKLAKSNPTLALLAVTLGSLIIVPPFVSWWKCTGRIRSADRLAGVTEINGWLVGGLCAVGVIVGITWIAIPAIVQDNINRIWRQLPEAGDGEAALPAGEAAAPAGAAAGEPKLSDIARED